MWTLCLKSLRIIHHHYAIMDSLHISQKCFIIDYPQCFHFFEIANFSIKYNYIYFFSLFLLFVSCLFFNVFIASKFSTWFSLFCLYTMSISLILRIIVNVRCRFFCRSSCNLLLYLIKFIQVNILCKSSHVFFCHILS